MTNIWERASNAELFIHACRKSISGENWEAARAEIASAKEELDALDRLIWERGK